MNLLSQKCQYAVRAIFELAKRKSTGALATVTEISQAQEIPPRFLEQILLQLRQGGFVDSRRGLQGGHMLAVDPSRLTVGDIIGHIEGRSKSNGSAGPDAPSSERVLSTVWSEAGHALSEVYSRWTFADLLERERLLAVNSAYDFSI